MSSTVTGQREDMVLVPRNPTKKMLYDAYDCALAEDAQAVWIAMIESFEKSIQDGEFDNG